MFMLGKHRSQTLILSKDSPLCKDSFNIYIAVVVRAAAVLVGYKDLTDPLTPGDFCVRALVALKTDSTNSCIWCLVLQMSQMCRTAYVSSSEMTGDVLDPSRRYRHCHDHSQRMQARCKST